MKYLMLTSLFSVAFSIAVSAQPATAAAPVCTNETVAGISSRGIKIGTKLDEILSIFATNEEQKEKMRRNQPSAGSKRHLGYEVFSAEPIDGGPNGKFEGISGYTFTFLDEKLTGFTVRYTKPKWKDGGQFADTMSGLLSLPKIDPNSGLICGDYLIRVYAWQDSSSFNVNDQRLDKIIKERVEKQNEDQRNADLKKFKP